jgi:predicted TPR repeat methyltransferase
MTDTGPLFVSSGDLIADRRYKWALDHAAQGDLSGAADILTQTVELAPRFATAWFALGAIRDQLGDRDGAVAAFGHARDADPEDYHGARLQLARLGSGEATPAMTETYVRRLFDQYAGRYDESLTERLSYRGPVLLRDAVQALMDAGGRPMRFATHARPRLRHGTWWRRVSCFCRSVGWRRSVAGHGRTGFREGSLRSPDRREHRAVPGRRNKSRQQIRSRHRGRRLCLRERSRADHRYAAARVLAPRGLLAFTVETHAGDGVKLLPTLRYAHGEAYIRTVLDKAGFKPVQIAKSSVRKEKGVPVDSLIVVAQPSSVGSDA